MGKSIGEQVKDILEGLSCILSAHDSCAELAEADEKRVVINCVGPCMSCDNRCIESAIKEKLPDIEVIIR